MLIFKSVCVGLVVYMTTMVIAGVLVGMSVTPSTKDVDILAEILLMSILVWFAIAAISLLFIVRINKTTLRATLARTIFLWLPINIGWFFTTYTGGPSWYVIGLIVSSLFLGYEVSVNKQRQMN